MHNQSTSFTTIALCLLIYIKNSNEASPWESTNQNNEGASARRSFRASYGALHDCQIPKCFTLLMMIPLKKLIEFVCFRIFCDETNLIVAAQELWSPRTRISTAFWAQILPCRPQSRFQIRQRQGQKYRREFNRKARTILWWDGNVFACLEFCRCHVEKARQRFLRAAFLAFT